MPRLARVTQQIFASAAANNGVFGSAQIGTKITSNSLPTIMGLAAWTQGWLSAVLGASKFPPLEEFQAVEYVHSTQIAYILQQGIPEYDGGTTYWTDNIVINPGTFQLYGSLQDGNVGQALNNAAYWKLLVDLSTIGSGNPIYIGGTSTGAANAQVLAVLTPTGFTLTNGFTITFTAGFTNTGATTLNANATGAIAVEKNSGGGPVALTGGEITAGNVVTVTYNTAASSFIITNSGGLLAANNLSDVQSAVTALANIGGASVNRNINAGGLVTGGGNLSADRTLTVTAAAKSDQNTATSNSLAVTPGNQQYHPSAVKAWANFQGGSGSINGSYNVTSITRNGVGNYNVNFTNAFVDANYAVSVTPSASDISYGPGVIFGMMGNVGTISAGTAQVYTCFTGASGQHSADDAIQVFTSFSGRQ
jgi:hypothetical protein